MKKTLIYLAIAVALVFLTSCEKEDPDYCWACKKDISMPGSYTSFTFTMCGMTDLERAQFERDNTSISGSTKTSVVCHLQ
jgi:predicted RNA-binding Zn-ribbon protein involved in translation (DUF1610 family)